MGRKYRRWTDRVADEYLTHLRRHGLLKQAARAVGVSYSNVQRIRREDPLFAQQCQEALDEAAEGLEAEAWRRAVEGWDTPPITEASPLPWR